MGHTLKVVAAAAAAVAAMTLAACGGGGGDTDSPQTERTFAPAPAADKDSARQAPAADIDGASKGGTITVYMPGEPGPSTLDPTASWYVATNSIQQGLLSRSLTQYSRDPDTGNMVLVPDLATDLGTPNDDFTEWTFQIRDDATWEDGSVITPEEIAWGITRSMDSGTFPAGAGTQYSQTYFLGAGEYEGPYTDPSTDWDGVEFDNEQGTLTIKMTKPFPDMDYWGSFMTMGPVPLGEESDPPGYGRHPKANGPYEIESFRPDEELVLVRNEEWDPNTDPGRHQYADKWVFKFDQDQNKVDQIMLSDNTGSQTAMATIFGAVNYAQGSEELGDRLLQAAVPCTAFLAPDYDKISDLRVRKAIAYATPYENMWLAGGGVPGVTNIPANSVMPPGMAGKSDYFADGEQFSYQPDKARALLKEAGYEPGEFELSMIYYEPDPGAVDAQEQLVKGLEDGGFSVAYGGYPVQVSPYDVWTDPNNKINQKLNLRGMSWCADWPSGLTMLPPLLGKDATYNVAHFDEPAIQEEMDGIESLPIEEQADAWGALDEKIGTEYLPMIPTSFLNNLYAFGSRIGNGTGDSASGAPNYKDMFVIE